MTNAGADALDRVTIVGAGRVGRALADALSNTGAAIRGPLARGQWEQSIDAGDVVLLCVPDSVIAGAAAHVRADAIVGHCSGALPLDVLGSRRAFSMHPLLAIAGPGAHFAGAAAAIAGTDDEVRGIARRLAERLGMTPIEVSNRSLYHAAAVLASNYLVALEETAALLGADVGLERRHLARLAESALSNWTRDGARSLTGPIMRGDETVVARQRSEVARVHPELLALWDALTARTREIAAEMKH
jgi:predicted short-subunit dehydrogenase-like oxidoreductase (DUF2520 family)